MDWKRGNQLSSYLRSSLWIVPIGAVILEQIFAPPVRMLDARLGWSWLGLGVEGARALCNAVVNLTLTFTVFTFGSLLIAIQVASGQYTPRIIATTLLCNNVVRYTVGLFVFSFVFAIQAVNRVENTVPQLLVFLTGSLGFACLASFLFLIDYAARLLRPVSLVQNVGESGLKVIDSVYPEDIDTTRNKSLPEIQLTSPVVGDPAKRTILRQGSSAIVLAVNTPKLLTEAIKTKGVVELAPQVGDFVGVGEPLFRLYGSAASIADQTLEGCVIFGSERTLEQDPLFAFRILVDIANKALSPAINDPTTAVLAIDQLHRLLRRAGRRDLRTDYLFDPSGDVRVVLRTPNWEDFVELAFTEIRFYGTANIQIPRRVRAMILNLANTLSPERHPALRRQLDLLDRMLEKFYVLPEDLALARVPDTQGLGGSTHTIAASWKV